MAIAQVALGSDESAWLAADRPVMLGSHLWTTPTQALWNSSKGTFVEQAHASYPSVYGYDGLNTIKTMPNATASEWNYQIQFASAVTIDAIAIIGYSGATPGLTVLYMDDDATLTAQFESISESGLTLLDARYTGVTHAGVYFSFAPGTGQPSFREILIGTRRQLSTKMDRPHDPDNLMLRSRMGETEAASGATSRYTFYNNRTVLNGDFVVDSTDLATLRALHETDTHGGVKPFVYCENPNSSLTDIRLMMFNNPEWSAQRETHAKWRVPFQAKEQGANFYSAV